MTNYLEFCMEFSESLLKGQIYASNGQWYINLVSSKTLYEINWETKPIVFCPFCGRELFLDGH